MEEKEHMICTAFVKWFSLSFPELLDYLNHSPNEGKRTGFQGAYLKRMGVRKGWPDYQLAFPQNGSCGLFVEVKTKKNKRRNPDQDRILSNLEQVGYTATYAIGLDELISIFEKYLRDYKNERMKERKPCVYPKSNTLS